jgi:hypothetical protein
MQGNAPLAGESLSDDAEALLFQSRDPFGRGGNTKAQLLCAPLCGVRHLGGSERSRGGSEQRGAGPTGLSRPRRGMRSVRPGRGKDWQGGNAVAQSFGSCLPSMVLTPSRLTTPTT